MRGSLQGECMKPEDWVTSDLITASDPNLPLEVRVAAGARLWDILARAQKAVDSLKPALRMEARTKIQGAGSTTIEGTGMTRALVTIPESSLQVIKDANMTVLKRLLGGRFTHLFEESVTYKVRPNIEHSIQKLNSKEQAAVFAAIREVEGTPRVSFQFAGANLLELSSPPDEKE